MSSDALFKVQVAERDVSLPRRGFGAVFWGISSFLEPCSCVRVSKIGVFLRDTALNGIQNDFKVLVVI